MQQFSGICIYLECSIDIKYLAISHTGFVTIIYYLSYCFLSYGFWLIIVIPLQQVLHYYISFFLCIQRYSRPAPIYELFMMSFWTLYQRFSLYVKLLRLLMRPTICYSQRARNTMSRYQPPGGGGALRVRAFIDGGGGIRSPDEDAGGDTLESQQNSPLLGEGRRHL